jgi:hypothetical protein
LAVAGWILGAGLAAVGGLALRAPGVVAVGVAGLLAGLTAAAIARDTPGSSRRSIAEVAAFATAGTLGALLVLSGAATLVGGAITAVLLVLAVVVGWLVLGRRWSSGPRSDTGRRPTSSVVPLAAIADAAAKPVVAMSTAELGREWLRTSEVMAGSLDAARRRTIVERREATLDELERRDPDGFGRWMAEGPAPGSDPAQYVRGGPVAGTEAA